MAPLVALLGLVTALAGESFTDEPRPPTPIVGGEVVAPGAWPEIVAIDLGRLQCTGTLVAPNLVLTAAHCFADGPLPEKVRVIIGDESVQPTWQTTAQVYRLHPDYCVDCDWDAFDFAYVVLREDAPATPAKILTSQAQWNDLMDEGASVLLIGYGNDEKGLGSIKRQAATTIRRYSESFLEFLAGGDGVDSCHGDSGGPAYVTTKDGEVLLAGVLSRGYPCGQGGFYGIAYSAVCWVSDDSGINIRPGECDTCDCINYEGGCSKCQTSPRGGDALALLLPLTVAAVGRRRRHRGSPG